jgi:hypothetical protein
MITVRCSRSLLCSYTLDLLPPVWREPEAVKRLQDSLELRFTDVTDEAVGRWKRE